MSRILYTIVVLLYLSFGIFTKAQELVEIDEGSDCPAGYSGPYINPQCQHPPCPTGRYCFKTHEWNIKLWIKDVQLLLILTAKLSFIV